MIRAIVVDDELKGQKNLEFFLSSYCPQVEIVGIAGNAKDAFKLINDQKPNLLFLDIEMPQENGFQLLEKFDDINFEIIFTTAYDQYAIQAIKYAALDYILKPIDVDELEEAVKKVEKKFTKNDNHSEVFMNDQIKALLNNIEEKQTKKIAIPVAEGLELIEIDSIIRCQSSSNYTHIFLNNKKRITVPKTLSDIEKQLPENIFIRSHKSHLVNKNYVTKYIKNDGSYLVLEDETSVEVSRRKRQEIEKEIC